MNQVSRINLSFRMAVSSVFMCLMVSVACAESGQVPQPGGGGGAGPWSRVELVDRYSVTGNVQDDRNLSGIACISDKNCLVGDDEGRAVQLAELSRSAKTLKLTKTIPLLRSGKEIDIEAIAAEGSSYYVVGSHGVSKKKAEEQSNRFKIFRLKMNLETGMPADVNVASLSDVLLADAVLGEHFKRPLQQNGVNIEGLAVRDGRLFVGFRSPNLGGYAFVMEIAADDVFAHRPNPPYTLHKLRLGEGLGIREIVAAKSGFLIIAGNAGSEPSKKFAESENYEKGRGYSLVFWQGSGSDVHRIGPIPNPPGKAEAMTILDESPSEITVLILFDGPRGGQPSVYRIR